MLSGDFGMYLVAVIVWLVTAILTAYAAFLIIMSKVAMALLLAVGPIFIVMSLFQATQRFFESWLAMVINFGLLLILSVAAVQIVMNLFSQLINGVHSTVGISTGDMIAIVIMVIINGLILRQIPSMASALGGGVALATQGTFFGAMHKMGAAKRHLRPTNKFDKINVRERGKSREKLDETEVDN